MFLKEFYLNNYKVLGDISIQFDKKEDYSIFPIISANGSGKSTLLQVIFAFLHCAFKHDRHRYLSNLLEYFATKAYSEPLRIVGYKFDYKKRSAVLDFYICDQDYKDLNFNSIIELSELEEKREELRDAVQKIDTLKKLEMDIRNSNISSAMAFHELNEFIPDKREAQLLRRGDVNSHLEFIKKIKGNLESKLTQEDEINKLQIKAEADKNKLDEELEKGGFAYAFHFNQNRKVLLYKSDLESDSLNELSDSIYLATPNTQVLQFFDDNELSSLFSKSKYVYSSYDSYIRDCQTHLEGLFTYDFSTINLILDAFKKARDNDFKKALETGEYGNQVQSTREELNNLLQGKDITIENDFSGVNFFTKANRIQLTPKDLSHGELKKLSIYIWIKAKTKDNSLILMDEVDMGLHPSWQHEIHDDLQNWSNGSQFLLATHSPQIISKSYFKNLVALHKEKDTASSLQFDKAPLESDLNTIVKTIMGGEYLPKELLELRQKYRELFDKNKHDSEDARKIKDKILIYESENSSFFQDLKFQTFLKQ